MPLRTSILIAELFFDFSALGVPFRGSPPYRDCYWSCRHCFDCSGIVSTSTGYFSELLAEIWRFALEPSYATEIIIIVVVGHVKCHNPCLLEADGGKGSVTTGFSLVI